MKLRKKRDTGSRIDPAKNFDIEKRIMNVAEAGKTTTVILYGRSGTGKTTLSASFPKPLLILNAKDDGTDSISDVKDVKCLDIRGWQDLVDAYWFIKKSKKFKSVVIDTVSNCQELAIREVKGDTLEEGERPGDWGTMTKRDWGKVSSMMKDQLLNYRDLAKEVGVNVVFIAQDRVNKEDGEDNEDGMIMPEVGPRIMPSVASVLNAAVNVIGNTFVRERYKEVKIGKRKTTKRYIDYCLRVGPHGFYTTKLRKPKSSAVPAFIKDPDYNKLIAAIKGELEE